MKEYLYITIEDILNIGKQSVIKAVNKQTPFTYTIKELEEMIENKRSPVEIYFGTTHKRITWSSSGYAETCDDTEKLKVYVTNKIGGEIL